MQSWIPASFVLVGSILLQYSLVSEAIGAGPAPHDPADPIRQERRSLEGEWECLYWNYEGITGGVDMESLAADPWLRPITAGETWSWRPDPRSAPVLYARLSPGDDGRAIDLATADRKETLRGIYEVRGNILRICLGTDRPGAARPVDLTVPPLGRQVAMTYRRVGVGFKDAKLVEMAGINDAIGADTAASEFFTRLSFAASAGQLPDQAFEMGVPHYESTLLKRLRASIGVVPVRVAASASSLNDQAHSRLARAIERGARLKRVDQEWRTGVLAETKKRQEAAVPIGPMPVVLDPASLRKRTVAELKSLRQGEIKAADRAVKLAESCRDQQATDAAMMNIPIDKMPEKLRPTDAQQVLEWGRDLLDGEPYTLERYRLLKSIYWTEVGNRHGLNMVVISKALEEK